MANEAVGFWAARQQSDVFWPAGAICGIGAALDYTVNKGFVVALLVGYERPEEDVGLSDGSELRRRSAKVVKNSSTSEPVKFTPVGSHKPRVTGFRDLYNPGGG